MSSSPNDEAAPAPTLPAALTPRLAAALAASFALHAGAIATLNALPQGMRLGELALRPPGGARKPLQVTLRAIETGPAPSAVAGAASPPLPPPLPPGAPATSGPAPEPAFAPLPIPTLHYYSTKELDVRPGILVRVEPEYPEAAARRFLSGRVVARLLIDTAGAVEQVLIVSADPPGYFEEAAAKAFRSARFTPGMKGGHAVRVQLLLEVTFDSPPPPKAPTGA